MHDDKDARRQRALDAVTRSMALHAARVLSATREFAAELAAAGVSPAVIDGEIRAQLADGARKLAERSPLLEPDAAQARYRERLRLDMTADESARWLP